MLTLKQLFTDENGQDLIEYALIASLVALGALTTLRTLSSTISSAFSTIGSSLTSAT